MENGVFSSMENLRHLYIEGDMINIRAGIFEGLEMWDGTLSLTNMSISSLPNNVFAHLTQLQVLFLAKNPLNDLNSETFYGLRGVSWLDLSYSNANIIPGLFKHMPGLKNLDLSGTPFKITANIWQGVALKELIVENAGLFGLNARIWTGLEGSLEALTLSYNHFPTLSANSVLGLSKLKYLSLQKSGIEHINPGAFQQLGALVELYLNGNRLQSLKPHSFLGLTKLWYLTLQNCAIEQMDARALEGLESLEKLNLAANPLIKIDSFMFGTTPLEDKVFIFFDFSSMFCVNDLCWVDNKVQNTNLGNQGKTKCDNYNQTVRQYLESEC